MEIGLQIRRFARKARPCMACRSLFVVPFVLELSGRVLSYSDKLWGGMAVVVREGGRGAAVSVGGAGNWVEGLSLASSSHCLRESRCFA